MGGYADVVIKIPILVLPVLLCWLMDDDEWWWWRWVQWRTYNCGMPHYWWTSVEDLQWFDASFTSWWGGVITSYVSFMGPQCGTAYTSLWQPHWSHPGTPYLTVAWTAAWPRPQTWCKPPWLCHHWRTCTWGATKWLQLVAGWVCNVVPMQEMLLGGAGLSPTRTVILLESSLGVDFVPDSGNAPGHWSESSV